MNTWFSFLGGLLATNNMVAYLSNNAVMTVVTVLIIFIALALLVPMLKSFLKAAF